MAVKNLGGVTYWQPESEGPIDTSETNIPVPRYAIVENEKPIYLAPVTDEPAAE